MPAPQDDDKEPSFALAGLFNPTPEILLPAGTHLYLEGERAIHAYMLKRGQVSLFRTSEHGAEVQVGERQAGSFVGLEAILFADYCSAARTMTECSLLSIDRETLSRVVERHPGFAWGLIQDLVREIHDLQRTYADVTCRSARQRVATFLLKEAEASASGLEVRMPWGSKARLARRLAIRQETLSRTLQEIMNSGAIRLSPRGVVIVDPNQLEQMAVV